MEIAFKCFSFLPFVPSHGTEIIWRGVNRARPFGTALFALSTRDFFFIIFITFSPLLFNLFSAFAFTPLHSTTVQRTITKELL